MYERIGLPAIGQFFRSQGYRSSRLPLARVPLVALGPCCLDYVITPE
jgi:hypothetical protein